MFTGGLPSFDINDLTVFNNDNYDSVFGFDEWEILPNVAGPSQSYTGVGDLKKYPDFPSPSSAPTSLYPTEGVIQNERYNTPFYQGVTEPSQRAGTTPPHLSAHYPAPPPIQTLSCGFQSLSPESHNAPITPPRYPSTQPQVIPDLNDLGLGFPTTAGSSSLPMAHASPPYIPSYEELWGQCSQSDSIRLDVPPFHPITDAIPSENPLPAPVASSSGPKRAGKSEREARKYNPVKPAKKKTDSKKGGWDQALDRFQTEFNTLYSVYNEQSSGGLEPAMVLASVDRFVKEDLKLSPLRGTEAGKGKRSRDVEKYLEGLLKEIRPTPIPAGIGSGGDHTTVTAFSRLADELEARLAAVNQQLALRRSANASKPRQKVGGERKEKDAKKNGTEKARRDLEWQHLERVSRLFRLSREQWSKKDVLSLAVLFLLYDTKAFPHAFVEVRQGSPRRTDAVDKL